MKSWILTCSCCKKQYLRQTVEESRFRWNNYKSNWRKQQSEICMQQNLYEHFCNSNQICFISDASVTLTKLIYLGLLKETITGEVPWKLWLNLVLILKKVYEGLCFWYPCCVALGAAMLGAFLNFLLGIVRIWMYVRSRIMLLDNDFH